ncbi:MAG: lysoplasmalogenase [Candidatus Heimdallarchaeota archaeon]|nr:MAG: lysoplasmalogenase [Candidatus Heimdallarchaeota archaeon]
MENQTIQRLANTTSTFIKGLPAIFAAFFVLIMRLNDSFFYLILFGAFFFCFAGDIGLEKGILIGLPLFLIAQFLLSIAFLGQAVAIGLTINNLILSTVVVFVVVLYMFMFLRYLDSSETGLGEFKIPVIAYCVVISLMFVSSFLLWIAIGKLESIVVVFGALIFIVSDSLIGIHEFHHKISKNVLKVMVTYYIAIFLLSLSVLVI